MANKDARRRRIEEEEEEEEPLMGGTSNNIDHVFPGRQRNNKEAAQTMNACSQEEKEGEKASSLLRVSFVESRVGGGVVLRRRRRRRQ